MFHKRNINKEKTIRNAKKEKLWGEEIGFIECCGGVQG